MSYTSRLRLDKAVKLFYVVLSVVTLLTSWYFLYLYLLSWTEGAFVPWNIVDTNLPALGTLPRLMNDFFDGPIGGRLPGQLVILLSFLVVCIRLLRTRGRISVLWEAIAINIMFLLGLQIAYLAGIIFEGVWSVLLRTPVVTPRFPFTELFLVTLLWLGLIILQVRGLQITSSARGSVA